MFVALYWVPKLELSKLSSLLSFFSGLFNWVHYDLYDTSIVQTFGAIEITIVFNNNQAP
jgi:hypothetical protein